MQTSSSNTSTSTAPVMFRPLKEYRISLDLWIWLFFNNFLFFKICF